MLPVHQKLPWTLPVHQEMPKKANDLWCSQLWKQQVMSQAWSVPPSMPVHLSVG